MSIEGGLESRAVEATMKHGAALTSHDAGDRKREAFGRGVEAMRKAAAVWLQERGFGGLSILIRSLPFPEDKP